MSERAFEFILINERERKPRTRGLTEIRAPYYTPVGRHYLADIFETVGAYVDSFKFAGGSFALMPRERLKEIIDLCHRYDVLISTGGFIERVLTQGAEAVEQYMVIIYLTQDGRFMAFYRSEYLRICHLGKYRPASSR